MSAPRWRAVPAGPDADPGALWRYVVAPLWVAAVPAAVRPGVLNALLELRAATAPTLEAVVGVIPLQGEDAVADFAVAVLVNDEPVEGAEHDAAVPEPRGSTASIIVRGTASVAVFGGGDVRQLQSRGIQPWLLADFRAVTALSFSVAGARTIAAAELPPPGATASADGDGQWAEQGGAQQGSALSGQRLDLVLGVPNEADAGGAGEEDALLAPPMSRMRVGGDVFSLDLDSYIGRRPHATQLAHSTARLVTVPSPAHEVSATHLLIGQRGAEVHVTDLKSTNGSLVELPDGSQLRLPAGEPTVIPPLSRILLGDGVVIELLAAAAPGRAGRR